ncbi:HD domain-containing protein [Aggregatilinea lenta]|uniref:HD domain-containing protein n=1 Tax=Aggregatilinea lenta TaxID=913108 RepID=UPI000E5B0890|nr:HD domain-containing protein [Aggregatilinea lenta]
MPGVYYDQQALKPLLEKLLVGAAQPMDSVGHWADRLLDDPPSPLAIRFLDQLNGEWQDVQAPDRASERIASMVKRYLATRQPGWPHLWAHTLRVTGAAVAIARERQTDPVLSFLAGVLHDVAKLDEANSSESHEELGAEFAGRVLHDRFSEDTIRQIQAAILKENGSVLGEVLHDADKLDKIGAAGVLRRISTDTHTTWIPDALDRVADDRDDFPAMHADTSRDMADSKLAFLDMFLPAAQTAAQSWR